LHTATRLKIATLGATNFIVVLVSTLLFPIFPAMERALEINIRELSLIIAVTSFSAAILSPLGGILADRWNRKHVITTSLILYGLGGLLAGLAIVYLANPFPVILTGRLLQGIGTATPMFLTIALAGDMFQSKERYKTVGLLEAANGLGKILSPIIGGTIGLLLWYLPFFLYPLLALPIALAIWLTVQEPKHPPVGWQDQKEAFRLFRNRSRILTLLAGVVTIFVLIGTQFWLSNMLETKLDGGKFIRGLILSLPVIFMMLTTFLSGILGSKLGTRFTIGSGMFLMAASLFLIPSLFESLLFWPILAVIGIGAGMILPAMDTVSTAAAKKEYRGILTTTYGASRSMGSALAPYIFAVLMEGGNLAPFMPVATGTVVAGAVVLLFLNNQEILPPELLPEEDNGEAS